MTDYYQSRLSSERLAAVYACATPRVRQYLAAEIGFARAHIGSSHSVLELGCGYGRILEALLPHPGRLMGIDNAPASLILAHHGRPIGRHARFAAMDASALALADRSFDCVLCLQNGICAFRVDPVNLLKEALRVTRPGGSILVSTYSDGFWPYRLEWFRIQSELRLLGRIDEAETGNGVIACRDGFRSGTARPCDFEKWAEACGVACRLEEVDGSSLFCLMEAPATAAPQLRRL